MTSQLSDFLTNQQKEMVNFSLNTVDEAYRVIRLEVVNDLMNRLSQDLGDVPLNKILLDFGLKENPSLSEKTKLSIKTIAEILVTGKDR